MTPQIWTITAILMQLAGAAAWHGGGSHSTPTKLLCIAIIFICHSITIALCLSAYN